MKFDTQIAWMEECLSVDPGDLTDDSIKSIYGELDPEGNGMDIRFIDLEGAGGVRRGSAF